MNGIRSDVPRRFAGLVAATLWALPTTAWAQAGGVPAGTGRSHAVDALILAALAGGCLFAVCRGSRKL